MLRLGLRSLYLCQRRFTRHLSISTLHSSPKPAPANKSTSVNADGETVVHLSFASEPLGLPSEDGFGWADVDFNQTIGTERSYTILRKLGWGMTSSTWLAQDQVTNSFVAVKILTEYYTDLADHGRVRELDVLKLMGSPTSHPHCLPILSSFAIPAKHTTGKHLCIVTPLLGGDVKSLITSLRDRVISPLPLAKRILLHTLRGICHAHSCGVVHTDIKHDNIFFDTPISPESLMKLLASNPSKKHPPEQSKLAIVEAAVSQPLPLPTLEEAMKRNFVLADFGCARLVDEIVPEKISSIPLRPPEVLIGGPWDKSVDIWSFGCLIFEIITRRILFRIEARPECKLDEIENLIYQMLCYTGSEDFPPSVLQYSRKASQYFTTDCLLRKDPKLVYFPFEESLRAYNVIGDVNLKPTADLMRRCLCIDPQERASAADLLQDPWFVGVE